MAKRAKKFVETVVCGPARPDVSLREVFDNAFAHMNLQRAKSTDSSGDCSMYRGESEHRCPVGIFIDDRAYHKGLEGMRADDPEVLEALIFVPTKPVISLLKKLQTIHDVVEPKLWRTRMQSLRRDLKLGGRTR